MGVDEDRLYFLLSNNAVARNQFLVLKVRGGCSWRRILLK